MSQEKKPRESQTSFTIEHERKDPHQVPSVTKLLNRRSLRLERKAEGSPPQESGSLLLESSPSPTAFPEKTEMMELSAAIEPHAHLERTPSIQLEAPPEALLESDTSLPPTKATSRSSIEITTDPQDAALEISSGVGGAPLGSMTEPASAVGSTGTSPVPRPPKIQRSTRKRTASPQALISWEPSQLAKGSDPLGKGIDLLLKKGAISILFLAIAPPPAGSPVPVFVATAAVNSSAKDPFWTGLSWDPRVVPEMWNYFVKTGQVELPPPGTMTNQNSNRNVVRASFGIQQTEWLLLLRAGPASACRGVVAVISNQSLLSQLEEALSYLTASFNPPQ